MGEIHILIKLIDEKTNKILEVLVNNPRAFYLKELSDKSTVPIATTYRILQKLEKLKIIQVMKISKFKLYTFSSNKDTEFLSNLFLDKKNALDIFVSKVKKEPSVESILLQGEEEEDKANLIIIGGRVDSLLLDNIVAEIKQETGFEISFVVVNEVQFKKMTSMGLYSGKKTILYTN